MILNGEMNEPEALDSEASAAVEPSGDVTLLLNQWSDGDSEAFDALLTQVYPELRRMAANYVRRDSCEPMLQPTELIDETYLRLVSTRNFKWQNRNQFFGIAATLMRRILVDRARGLHAAKRGANAKNLAIDEAYARGGDLDENLILLDQALHRLESVDPQACRLVELRYFVGLTIAETAEVLEISPTTVKREWAAARAWLYRQIY